MYSVEHWVSWQFSLVFFFRFNPYTTFNKCRICKQTVHQAHSHYCQSMWDCYRREFHCDLVFFLRIRRQWFFDHSPWKQWWKDVFWRTCVVCKTILCFKLAFPHQPFFVFVSRVLGFWRRLNRHFQHFFFWRCLKECKQLCSKLYSETTWLWLVVSLQFWKLLTQF